MLSDSTLPHQCWEVFSTPPQSWFTLHGFISFLTLLLSISSIPLDRDALIFALLCLPPHLTPSPGFRLLFFSSIGLQSFPLRLFPNLFFLWIKTPPQFTVFPRRTFKAIPAPLVLKTGISFMSFIQWSLGKPPMPPPASPGCQHTVRCFGADCSSFPLTASQSPPRSLCSLNYSPTPLTLFKTTKKAFFFLAPAFFAFFFMIFFVTLFPSNSLVLFTFFRAIIPVSPWQFGGKIL